MSLQNKVCISSFHVIVKVHLYLVYDVEVAVGCGQVGCEDGGISNVDQLENYLKKKNAEVKR